MGNLIETSVITLEGSGAVTANNAVVEANDSTFDNRVSGNGGGSFTATFELNVGFDTAPSVGTTIECYLVPALDGSNYAEIDVTTPRMPASLRRGFFSVLRSQTAAQRLIIEAIPLQPLLYKAYLWNKTGHSMSSGWTLKAVGAKTQ